MARNSKIQIILDFISSCIFGPVASSVCLTKTIFFICCFFSSKAGVVVHLTEKSCSSFSCRTSEGLEFDLEFSCSFSYGPARSNGPKKKSKSGFLQKPNHFWNPLFFFNQPIDWKNVENIHIQTKVFRRPVIEPGSTAQHRWLLISFLADN